MVVEATLVFVAVVVVSGVSVLVVEVAVVVAAASVVVGSSVVVVELTVKALVVVAGIPVVVDTCHFVCSFQRFQRQLRFAPGI